MTRDIKCQNCFDLGFETYIIDGKNGQPGEQGHSRCPDCVNKERGIPIPPSELGL